MQDFRIKVADVVIWVICDLSILNLSWFDGFLTTDPPDIVVKIHRGELPQVPTSARGLLHSRGEGWRFHYDEKSYVGVLDDDQLPIPSTVVTTKEESTVFDFYTFVSRPANQEFCEIEKQYVMPLMFALSDRCGFLLHSAGVRIQGGGVLFSGISGTGKTTMAQLWQNSNHGVVLNDDVCAVRKIGKQFQVYGTPWLGSGRLATSQMAPLRGIFFLEHGVENRLTPLALPQALSQIVSQTFLPRWDGVKTSHVLDACVELAVNVPSFHLAFKPSHEVVDLVQSVLG